MRTNAPGQLFGYTLQYPRALLRLLEADENTSVTIEEFADVGIITESGKIAEEDKSTIVSCNPVSDLSKNLWKSFYNWINLIIERRLNPDYDKFVLYANFTPPTNSLVYKLDDAKRININNTITEVNEKLTHMCASNDPDINEYGSFISENIDIFRQVLMKFEFVPDKKADNVYSEIEKNIRERLLLPKGREIEWFLDSITGWLQRTIMQRIADKEEIIISKEQLREYMYPLVSKLMNEELIDYASLKMPENDYLTEQVNSRPVYIRQLEYINVDPDEKVDAVLDYYKSSSNRLTWIEDEIVTEKDMSDFEQNLISHYRNERKRIELTEKCETLEAKGHLLFLNCQEKQVRIAEKEPPFRTVAGAYHALSNEKTIGWHPEWEKKMEEEDKNE